MLNLSYSVRLLFCVSYPVLPNQTSVETCSRSDGTTIRDQILFFNCLTVTTDNVVVVFVLYVDFLYSLQGVRFAKCCEIKAFNRRFLLADAHMWMCSADRSFLSF